MCLFEDHDRMHPTGNYDASSGYGRLMTYESTIDAFLPLGIKMNFIDSCIQSLKKKYLQKTAMYGEKMSKLLKKTPVTIPERNPGDLKTEECC